MISGSYTGGITFFKGLGKQKFAAGKKLLQKNGKPLSDEAAQTPCLGDWDGDGDFDMSVGFIQGPVKLYENKGKMQFVEKGKFTVDGKVVNASDGGPCIVDWDTDGVLDLLVGDGEGNVAFYKGKKKGSLDLTVGETFLLPKQAMQGGWEERKIDAKSPVGFSPARPGSRAKPYAADWNGDGKLDLLVGDYIQLQRPAIQLTAAKKEELAALEKKNKEVQKAYVDASQKISKEALKEVGKKDFTSPMTRAESQKYSDAYSRLMNKDKKFVALRDEMSAIYQKLQALKPGADGTGLVWVYLRK